MCERPLVALTQKGGLWDLDIAVLCRPSEVQKVHEGLAWASPGKGSMGPPSTTLPLPLILESGSSHHRPSAWDAA